MTVSEHRVRVRGALFALLFSLGGCYQSHGLPSAADAGRTTDAGARDTTDAGACDLSRVTCSALPECVGDDPPETLYCDDVRICLRSDPGDAMARAIALVADRIVCTRADSCDFLCAIADGGFDDEVRSELCEITRVAPAAMIECAIYGP